MWFPQTLKGQMLTDITEAAQTDEMLRTMLASPQDFLAHAHQHPGEQFYPEFIGEAYGWLGQWDEQLHHVDREEMQRAGNEDRKNFLWRRARPLLDLRRPTEAFLSDDGAEAPRLLGFRHF